jgi:hypothetical protein
MDKILILIFCFFYSGIFAQKEEKKLDYSYFNDRKFSDISDFYGHPFYPRSGKLSNGHFDEPFKAGLVKFVLNPIGIFITENVNFSTGGISGESEKPTYRMTVSRTSRTDFGFEFVVTDIQNPNIQGHIKFFTDKGFIQAIRFKPDKTSTERVYYLSGITKSIESQDNEYFTHENEIFAENFNSLNELTIHPFAELKDNQGFKDFYRIQAEDSVSFKIVESTIQKGKNEKSIINIFFRDYRIKGRNEMVFIVKKINEELKFKDPVTGKERYAMEIQMIDEKKKTEYTCYFIRNITSRRLEAIRIADTEYIFRPGKKIINK